MAKRDSNYRCYIIPENVISGGRLMGFKTRNVIEGGVLGIIAAAIASAVLPGATLLDNLSGIVIIAAPPFLLGLVGINGYPLTTFVKNATTWFKQKSTILYNPSIRLLKLSPMDNALEQSDMRDRLACWYEQYQEKIRTVTKGEEEDLVEGKNFRFAEDKEEKDLLVDLPTPDAEPELELVEDGDPDEIVFDAEPETPADEPEPVTEVAPLEVVDGELEGIVLEAEEPIVEVDEATEVPAGDETQPEVEDQPETSAEALEEPSEPQDEEVGPAPTEQEMDAPEPKPEPIKPTTNGQGKKNKKKHKKKRK